jgi:acetyltransferase-like isoleucine patch superfamily enzyme
MISLNISAILAFSFTSGLATILSLLLVHLCLVYFSFGDFNSVVAIALFVTFLYTILILNYRAFLMFFPLKDAVMKPKSELEFIYHFYLLHYLIFFYSLTKTRAIPVAPMRLVYQLLGATLGHNSYCAGTILDPPLTRIGSNTILGHDCVLFAHAFESNRSPYYAAIDIGNHVTIGAKAIVMPAVTIEDHAIVAAGAVVTKGTVIGKGELWAGVPARRIKTLSPETVKVDESFDQPAIF